MKKTIITPLIYVLFPIFMFGQIKYDKVEQDGTRKIYSTDFFVRNKFTDTTISYYQIIAFKKDNNINYYLCVRLNGKVPHHLDKGSLLLIKTSNDDVIESNNVYDEHDTYDTFHKNIYGLYPISENNLNKITEGITKIRIESPLKTIDIEYPKKKSQFIGKEIADRLYAIRNALSINKKIRDDF